MYTYNIEVSKVIDGDTIDAVIDLGFDVTIKKRIRFMGINTPECRTRDKEEKKRGLAAKQRVAELLDIYAGIITGFAVPLRDEHVIFF